MPLTYTEELKQPVRNYEISYLKATFCQQDKRIRHLYHHAQSSYSTKIYGILYVRTQDYSESYRFSLNYRHIAALCLLSLSLFFLFTDT